MKSILGVDRRVFVAGSLLSTLILRQRQLWAADDERDDFFTPTVPDISQLGTQPATSEETRKALAILSGTAEKDSPYAIMNYLVGVTDQNNDGDRFNAGWPTRWNPLIVTFFNATHTQPSGDTTAWCAASMNWCLRQKGYSGTGSASSGSFRNAPGRTDNPQPGDIVVFREGDVKKAKQCYGHVGFYVAQDADTVTVCGGNQVNKQRQHHVICNQKVPKNDYLVLHSFHSIDVQPKQPATPPDQFSCPI